MKPIQSIGIVIWLFCMLWAIYMGISRWNVLLLERLSNEWPYWIIYGIVAVIAYLMYSTPRLFGGGK